jgi:uncharacterized protein YeaO (DUF488 family)
MQFHGLRQIFDHFLIKFQDFSGKFLNEFKKIQTCACYFLLNLAKHVHAKFQLSSFYPDRFRHIFDHF